MKRIFLDTRPLDAYAIKTYALSEDVLMENAAMGLQNTLFKNLSPDHLPSNSLPVCLILAGSGNNGADGYALSRRLKGTFIAPIVCAVKPPKSPMCILQSERAKKVGVDIVHKEEGENILKAGNACAIVECIFGSGFHGRMDKDTEDIIKEANKASCLKIACDIPCGIDTEGNIEGDAFASDITVTMGALKMGLYSDFAKDYCGHITCANLGISEDLFLKGEDKTEDKFFLLEESDIRLPVRKKQNVHKGSFGHVAVALNEMSGAAISAASSCISFGAGLVTLVGEDINSLFIPNSLMASRNLPESINTVALGMGFGRSEKAQSIIENYLSAIEERDLNIVLDADALYFPLIPQFLRERETSKRGTVLTPHPKEFSKLLEICYCQNISVSEVIKNRIKLCSKFCKDFPNTTLILKGANSVIAAWNAETSSANIFINPQGSSALAKAGSGDVLAGLIAALLAQGYTALESAKTASLVHAKAGSMAEPNFSLTTTTLIENVMAFCQNYSSL